MKIRTSEDREHDHTVVPEGFVDRPVPADEGHWGEEDKPEDGQTELDAA